MRDLLIIGAGPGGYVAAVRASELGMKVLLVDRHNKLGGTCLNVGCIPTKSLLHDSEHSKNFAKMMERKEQVVEGLTRSVADLMKQNKIEVVTGEAALTSATSIEVNGESYLAKEILLATGSTPIELPFLPFDEKRILSSTGALLLPEVPKSLVVVGGGVIGVEFASLYSRLGTQVTIIEMQDRLIPSMDFLLSEQLKRVLQKQGIQVETGARLLDGKVTYEVLGEKRVIDAEKILVAVGRRPFTGALGLKEMGIETAATGAVVVDDQFRTTLPTVRAIGDLIDGPMLAHKASYEAVAAVELMAGLTPRLTYAAIPNIVYTNPEAASVGLTEEEAKRTRRGLLIGKAHMRANARARCNDFPEGVVKVIGDRETGRLIGLHILSEHASELIGSGMMAIIKNASVKELAEAPWGHPTLSEAIQEAAKLALISV